MIYFIHVQEQLTLSHFIVISAWPGKERTRNGQVSKWESLSKGHRSDLCEADNISTEFLPICFIYHHWTWAHIPTVTLEWEGEGRRRGGRGQGALWPSVQTRCTALTTSWIWLLVLLSLVQFWRDGQELDYSSASLVHVDNQCNSTVNKTFTIYQREGERWRIERARTCMAAGLFFLPSPRFQASSYVGLGSLCWP